MGRYTFKLILLFFYLFSTDCLTQPLSSVGAWESFISYNNSKSIAASYNKLFCANELSLSTVYLEDNSISIYNKINGLNDMGISSISYSKEYSVLIIAYTNGNLDLLYDSGKIVNRPAIKQNTLITGDKSVKHIFCDSNNIYLSTDFGLVNFDLDIEEFGFTTFTPNVKVNSCGRFDNFLFMSTDNGIYQANLNSNLLDFNNWSKVGLTGGIQTNNYSSNSMISLNDTLYADVNDTIMRFDGSTWNHITTYYYENGISLPYCYSGFRNLKMRSNFNSSNVSISTGLNFCFVLDGLHRLYKFYYDPVTSGNVNDAIVDRNNILWTANQTGLNKINSNGGSELFALSGPSSNKISDMVVDNRGTLWCAGAIRSLLGPVFDKNGAYKYGERIWTNFNEKTNTLFNNVYDINSVAVNPKNREVYFGSLMSGLIKIGNNDSITVIDKNTPGTTLEYAIGNPGVTRVAGLAFDEEENLWMTNNITINPIVLLKKNGTWRSFPFNYNELSYMTIDRYGYKWIMRRDGQITVYDSGDDIDLASDDRFVTLNSSNSNLGGVVTALAADKNGSIWVGTSNGLTIYNCNVFESNCPGLRPVINPDNFNGRLLEAENIKTIAVDGANRKWIGTSNGVFLIDPETYEQILFFNEENSPLFSNQIIKIAVDGFYGMVYFATDKGLQGYRAEATDGKSFMNKNEVYVYPNPVRPDYDGSLSIKNLAEDVNVKITDISGNLVFEQTSYGGQAVWNCNDYLGRPVSSGVYLVFVVNDDGSQKLVTKFVLIR
jgi:hypothetical protein